jgi:acyl carrier protein
MTTARVFDAMKELIVQVTEVPERQGDRSGSPFFESPGAIRMETPLAELGLDSLAVTALAVEAESRFGITLSPVLMFEVHTVGDLVSRIESLIEEKGAS